MLRNAGKVFKCSRFSRMTVMGKQRGPKQILDGAANLVTQVNSLLISTANPSDDTSLSIRLSMVKVSNLF